MSFTPKKVLIIGAGTMGSGIAQWFSQQEVETHLTDLNSEQLEKAISKIQGSWEKLKAKGKFTDKETETFNTCLKASDFSSFDNDYDLIIEAIIENLEIKQNLFKDLDQKMESKTIIASNTSSFPIELLAQEISENRKKNFLGLHFFNPATIMKLVEVINSKDSNLELCKEIQTWFNDKGKKAALCKDSPGFIVNRVARNFYGEAFRICQEDKEEYYKELDEIIREVGGFRMGPYELMDLIGIDINYDVTCSVYEAFNKHSRFAPHKLQKLMVDSKRLGKKTNKGFYSYE